MGRWVSKEVATLPKSLAAAKGMVGEMNEIADLANLIRTLFGLTWILGGLGLIAVMWVLRDIGHIVIALRADLRRVPEAEPVDKSDDDPADFWKGEDR